MRSITRLAALIAVALSATPQHTERYTFSSPGEAVESLFQAVQARDEYAIRGILGLKAELVASPDAAQDSAERALFVEKFKQMHRVGRDLQGRPTLYIGAENWPFPVPLVKRGANWTFDGEAGATEIALRRTGENERAAIEACLGFLRDKTIPTGVTGYEFKVFDASGGGDVVLVAAPSEYRNSGVMTFIVTGLGVVWEKDLGPAESEAAKYAKKIEQDPTWSKVPR